MPDVEMIEKLSNYFENVSKPFPKPLSEKYIYEKGIYRATNTGDNSKIWILHWNIDNIQKTYSPNSRVQF